MLCCRKTFFWVHIIIDVKKDLVIGIGIGIPVVIFMILIGGGGHTPLNFESEYETPIVDETKQIEPILSLPTTQSSYSLQDCSGNARCFTGMVTQVIDGDTIKVDGQSIRFALSSAPELNEFGGDTARDFIDELCPVDSAVLVDEDDGQTLGSNGRIIGVIYCNGVNLNEELLDSGLGYLTSEFCDKSEFSNVPWAQKHGC